MSGSVGSTAVSSASLPLLVLFDDGTGPQVGVTTPEGIAPLDGPSEELAGFIEHIAQRGLPRPNTSRRLDPRAVRLLPPIARDARIFAVAQNYPTHAAEAGGPSPDTPVVFFKPASAFVGHRGVSPIPSVTSFLDYEGEIAVVIGRPLSCAAPSEAVAGIAGYTIANDGSARDLQPTILAGRPIVDWFSAKSLDQSSALGPGIADFRCAPEPSSMQILTTLNGEVVQDDVAASMHIPIPDLVSFISQRVALVPGDVILTGTPAGVGKARGRALQDGDAVTVSVTGLGELCVSYAAR